MDFFTKSPGIGGRIKQHAEDFVVEEIAGERPQGDEYTVFWLEKINIDANEAIDLLANRLHVSKARFGIAGTKDKRAFTKQRVSVWRIDPERMNNLKFRNMKVYGAEGSAERITLGKLSGNRFKITVRDISLKKEEIEERLSKIFSELEKGIPNYFGPQRFGEIREITHLVGKEMLKGTFQPAVKTYLAMIFEKEQEDAKSARKYLAEHWNKEGFAEALKLFPQRLRYERTVMEYLAKYPNDYAGSLRTLPKRLRKMFLNAVQARIWNRVAKVFAEKGEQMTIPLVGCGDKISDDQMGEEIRKAMEEEEISIESFCMPSMPELRCTGGRRELFLIPKGLGILQIGEDELNSGKLKVAVAFELPPGAYATELVKEIIKSQPLST